MRQTACKQQFEIGKNELGVPYSRMACGTNGWLCPTCVIALKSKLDRVLSANVAQAK